MTPTPHTRPRAIDRTGPAWPYLSADVAPIEGRLVPESDFRVEEVPAYEASGEGTHVHFSIEKTGMTTREAVRVVAHKLGIAERSVGFAGQKDSHAVTVQTLSVEHVEPERVLAIRTPHLSVLAAKLHGNKLKLGHLRGNRFVCRLRGIDPGRRPDVEGVLALLERRGLPNYFGLQRFGHRGDTWIVGRALLHDEPAEALRQIGGAPDDSETPAARAAREHFDAGRYDDAARAFPASMRESARAARAMARARGKARRALRSLDTSFLRFCVSAYQSWLFNQVVAERIKTLDALHTGDLAWRHAGGAVFRVEDAAVEAPRAASLEISPSGPLFGRRMTAPTGLAAEMEDRILDEAGETRARFGQASPWRPSGGRRPLRVPLQELELRDTEDELGAHLELRFRLPPGAYATGVLREILKQY
jgi:tRNA pseudouridine13 synthase